MFKSIKRSRVSDEVANQIKNLISDGQLKPGDRLPPERELIKQFGVSRPSLREALNALVTMGFLEIKQSKRTFVKSVASERMEDPLSFLIKTDTQKIFDLIEVRKAMEAWGATQAARGLLKKISNDWNPSSRRWRRPLKKVETGTRRMLTSTWP